MPSLLRLHFLKRWKNPGRATSWSPQAGNAVAHVFDVPMRPALVAAAGERERERARCFIPFKPLL